MSKSVPWRFGMAPLSHQTEKKNREAIIIVKDYVENSENTINTELAESISWVKGMYNRILKQDRWDWHTHWDYFGYPSFEDIREIVSALADLRKALIKNNDISKIQSIDTLVKYGFVKYCDEYLINVDSDNTVHVDVNKGYTGMKDYISKLSDEELELFAGIVSGKVLKEIFKSNPKDFQKVSFKRPGTLKYEECIKLVVKNRKNRFIQTIINGRAEYIVSETSRLIEDNTNEEMTADEALAKSIISFGFDEDVELFFKLTDRPIDEEYIHKITALIDEMRQKEEKEQQAESEAPAEVQTAPELPDTSQLESKLAEMQQREQTILEQYEAEKAAHESDTERYNEELESLKKQLSASQVKISELETEMNRLLVFDDSEVARSISSDYQHISLCQLAGYNSYNVLYANRLADVNSMGAINSFISDPFQEKKFANRDRLYPQGGPTEIGQFGIWQWSSEPNYADPSKDFLKYNYDPDLIPTEIIYLSECHSLDDVIQQLKTGVKNDPVSEKTIFAVLYDNGVIQGVCCTKSQLEANDGMVKLNEQVTAIPV